MEQSYLIELIQTLSSAEKNQILRFSEIPFFNSGRMRSSVGPLLEICLQHPWEKEPLDKLTLYNAIFPNQDFVEGKLEKVMVEAHKVVRAFLLAKKYFSAENDFQMTLDFAEIIRLRGLDARFQQLLAKLQKIQSEFPWRNEAYFQRQFLLERAVLDGESYRNQARGDLNIPQTLFALEIYYQINQVTLLNIFLLQNKLTNLTVPSHIQSILEKPSYLKNYVEESPNLRIKVAIFELLNKEHPDPSDVRNLFNLVLIHESSLDAASLREFYTYLRNICVLVSNSFFDNEEIRHTLFDLYKDNLSRGYLHYEGKLHPSTYISVSVAAVRVNQANWAIEFIEKYKNDLIGENETHDLYRLNKALCLFGMGQYSECLENIPDTASNVGYLMQGKRLGLQALYELRSDLLPYRLDAFKMFLSRTSSKLLSDSQRQLNIDFVNFLTQISTSVPGDLKRSDRLVQRLQEKKHAFEWRWLLEKAKALKLP